LAQLERDVKKTAKAAVAIKEKVRQKSAKSKSAKKDLTSSVVNQSEGKVTVKSPTKSKGKAVIEKSKVVKNKGKDLIAKAAAKAAEPAFKLVSKQVAQQEMDLLCQRYPEAECELDYDTTFQLLMAVIMSAQTTDVTVNKVTKTLFKRFPDAKTLAAASLDEIKEIIKPTGYYNAKAANIQTCAQALVDNFGGQVPATMDELITLPGVGRKTANVVLGVAFGVPGWTVDTHVQRLSQRLGFSKNTDPAKIEIDLQKFFPKQDWSKLSITLIWHGRRLCFARNPECHHCPINHLCPSSQV
jgi:endonuclease-3